MNALTVKELYTLEETIAKDLFDKVTYQRTREYVKQ